jgi:hypothetical protein
MYQEKSGNPVDSGGKNLNNNRKSERGPIAAKRPFCNVLIFNKSTKYYPNRRKKQKKNYFLMMNLNFRSM